MIEPYSEKKNPGFLDRIKERARILWQSDSVQRVRASKLAMLAILLAVVGLGSLTYTGYVTYTSQATATQSKLLILERQVNALQANLTDMQSSLAECNSELTTSKGELVSVEGSLNATLADLSTCLTKQQELTSGLNETQASLVKLREEYNILSSNFTALECNYAKNKDCGYFTFRDGDVECCLKIDENYYCGSEGTPTNEADVKTC